MKIHEISARDFAASRWRYYLIIAIGLKSIFSCAHSKDWPATGNEEPLFVSVLYPRRILVSGPCAHKYHRFPPLQESKFPLLQLLEYSKL